MKGRKFATSVFVALATLIVGATLAFGVPRASTLIGWGSRFSRPMASALRSVSEPEVAHARTISTVWHVASFKTFDVAPKGLSAGDSYVFSGPLFDRTDSHRVGFLSGQCVDTNPGLHSLATCQITATPHAHGPSLALGDQITLQGWNDDTPYPFKQAVTGGTGIYRNVRGDVLATPGDPFRIIFRLIP